LVKSCLYIDKRGVVRLFTCRISVVEHISADKQAIVFSVMNGCGYF